MGISEEAMQQAEHWFCLPVVMLINFSLFQYLCVLYFRRRTEVRIALLLTCAFIGFAVIIPQAHPRDSMVGHLNDASETCSTLTFLIQITVIGRDIERKVKIKSLKFLTFLAELLTMVSLLVVVFNFVQIVAPSVDISQFDGIDNFVENASLFYIFFFRFFYIAMSRGVKWTLVNKKLEILLYLLFMTHEYPFIALEAGTGVSWEAVQSIWHRITLMVCILMTIKEKMSSKRGKSRDGQSTVGFSRGPSVAHATTINDREDGDDDNNDDDATRKGSMISTIKTKVTGPSKPTTSRAAATPTPSQKSTAASTSGSCISSFMRSGFFSFRGVSLPRSAGCGSRHAAVTPAPANL